MTRRSPWFVATVIVAGILIVFALGLARYWFLGNGVEGFERARELTRIDETTARYEAAKREGKRPQACLLALDIAGSYVRIEDTEHYEQWRAIREADCAGFTGLRATDAATGKASP